MYIYINIYNVQMVQMFGSELTVMVSDIWVMSVHVVRNVWDGLSNTSLCDLAHEVLILFKTCTC